VTEVAHVPRRRSAEDRRKQLIGIGLRMLTERPIHQVTVDEVAAEAGISRSLLFHYFPTKQDYYAEVVRASSRRLLRAIRHDPALGPDDAVRAALGGYARFILRRREPYLSVFRGGNDWTRAIHDETRDAIAAVLLTALGTPAEGTALAVSAWLAFAEELCLTWPGRTEPAAVELTELLTGSLRHLVASTTSAR
jgi:AcrR family transcriptional regulator